LKSDSKSQQAFALTAISILDDENLKKAILETVPSIRRQILKKVRLNRTSVIESVVLDLFEISQREVQTVLPFLKDEKLVQSLIEKLNIQNPTYLLNNTFIRRKPKESMTYYRKNLLQRKKNGDSVSISLPNLTKFVSSSPKEFSELDEEINGEFAHQNVDLGIYAKDKKTYIKIFLALQSKKRSVYVQKKHLKKLKLTDEEMYQLFSSMKTDRNFVYSFLSPMLSLDVKSTERYFKYIATKEDLVALFENMSVSHLSFPSFLQSKIAESQLKIQMNKNVQITDVNQVGSYLNRMDISESRKTMEKVCSESNANNRAIGYVAMIQSTISSDKEYLETISYLTKKLKNEADPVKQSALAQLSTKKAKGFFAYPDELNQLLFPMFSSADRSLSTLSLIIITAHYAYHFNRESEKHHQFLFGILKHALKTEKNCQNSIRIENPTPKDLELFWKELKDICIEQLNEDDLSLSATLVNRFQVLRKEKSFVDMTTTMLSFMTKIPTHMGRNEFLTIINILLKNKSTKAELVEKILDMDQSAITIFKIQKFIFATKDSLLMPYIEKEEAISGKSLKGGRFIDNGSYLNFNRKLVLGHAHTLNFKVRKQLEKFLYSQYASDKFKTPEKRSFVFELAKMQIGGVSDEFLAISKAAQDLLDEKLKQAFDNSSLYLDVPDISRQLKEINAKNAKSICGSINSLIQYVSKEFSQKEILNFITDKSFNKKPVVVQKEICNLLSNFINSTVSKVLLDLWKSNPIEGVQGVISSLAVQFINVDDSMWTILEDASKSLALSVVSAVFKSKATLTKEQKHKMAKLQMNSLESSTVDVKSNAWSSIWYDCGVHDEMADICIKTLKDYSKTSDVYTYLSVITQMLLNCSHYNEKILDSIFDLFKSLLSEKEFLEIEEQNNCNPFNDLPIKKTILALTNSVSSDFTYLKKKGKSDILIDLAKLLVKHNFTFYSTSFRLIETCFDEKDPKKTIDTLIEMTKSIKELPENHLSYMTPNLRTEKLFDVLIDLVDDENYCYFFFRCAQRTSVAVRRANPKYEETMKKLRNHKNPLIKMAAISMEF
jgi:hypothetical protein